MAKDDSRNDLKFLDIFKSIDSDKLKIPNPIEVPDDAFRELLDNSMERSFLNNISKRKEFPCRNTDFPKVTWLKVSRLPVHPNNVDSYDLFNRWQGVLSSIHSWGYRFLFLLQRKEGKTNLYFGAVSNNPDLRSEDAIEQIMEAASGNMPGMELNALSEEEKTNIAFDFNGYKNIGAVTGLPSFYDEKDPGILQNLDSLAFGIRGINNDERPYSLLVMADPISDEGTNEIINRMRVLGSQIHTSVKRSLSESESSGENKQKGLNTYGAAQLGETLGTLAGSALGLAAGPLAFLGPLLGSVLGVGVGQLNKTLSKNYSLSVNTENIDKFAEYAEMLTEKHIARMKEGRNLGYWNVEVYVFGNSIQDITTVNGILRSIYAGRESYIEPIRLHIFDEESNAKDIVMKYNMVPLYDNSAEDMDEDVQWHIFGKYYQYVSTPMNTKELALTTSLPKRDVPGLRFVKTAVRFANNPPAAEGETICLGNMVDMGVEQNSEYRISYDDLVRHTLVTGSTGSGKTYTCKRILGELIKKDIPVLIIEPAKDDYVRWAIEQNKHLPDDKKFNIYMPGTDVFDGTELKQLKLNMFEPAAIKGAKVDMLSRCENLVALLNASLPSDDILPILIDETVYNTYLGLFREKFVGGKLMDQQNSYPLINEMMKMSDWVLDNRNYAPEVKSNLKACMATRFQYLVRGTRGNLINVEKSIDFSELFDKPTVINISGISASKDKALIMSLLMLSLNEYRKSQYTNDSVYRDKASSNKLLHLTLVEEAHNVLSNPGKNNSNSGNPQQVVADLFSNMLSEIRGYGEGIMIVDQVPVRLIPDAIKNTNYKIVHRLTSPDDCEIMAAGLALRDDQKALIPSLTQGHAIVYGDKDDAAAWVHMKK
ncbi:MAG: ATP-binding protein [Eubacterium sp.]|nr:ATP-binding protein [Eubacterium sp.]